MCKVARLLDISLEWCLYGWFAITLRFDCVWHNITLTALILNTRHILLHQTDELEVKHGHGENTPYPGSDYLGAGYNIGELTVFY